MKKLNVKERLHQSPLPIIAVTGCIGTGKSTILNILKKHNYPTVNADHLVKEIYQNSIEIKDILRQNQNHQNLIVNNDINFANLRIAFFKDDNLKKKLESIIYQELPKYFQKQIKNINSKFVFYEVPLLFELKLDTKVDYIVVAYLEIEEQIKRVQKRDNNSRELIEKVMENQTSLDSKVKLADIVLDTSNEKKLNHDISELLKMLEATFS